MRAEFRGWPGLAHDLTRFVGFPTVSADPARQPALVACAKWLANRVGAAGFPDVRVVTRRGAPAVIGVWQVDPRLPTVLLYGHYDVQPADAGNSWNGDPFVLRSVGGRLIGRGASDDKGFVLAQLEAVRRASGGRPEPRPPVNLRCLYEGEEEIGSPTLPHLLIGQRDMLRADSALVCDTEATPAGRPSLTLSCRGGITVEIEVRGPARDLHAGRFGGAVHNPAQVLAETIAALHDELGRVRLNGFYDRVRPVRSENLDERPILAAAGVNEGWGEREYSPAERVALRPAAIVTQLGAGLGSPGPHHVIPSKATAQLDIRLVPDQDPGDVYRSVTEHVKGHASAGIRATAHLWAVACPWHANLDKPAYLAAERAVRDVTGEPPVQVRSGGSIAALKQLEISDIAPAAVLLGFGDAADPLTGQGRA